MKFFFKLKEMFCNPTFQVHYGLVPYNESAQPNFKNFICSRNNGILFENAVIQVGVKSEFGGAEGEL